MIDTGRPLYTRLCGTIHTRTLDLLYHISSDRVQDQITGDVFMPILRTLNVREPAHRELQIAFSVV